MQDYQSNSKRSKEEPGKAAPKKEIEKVVVGEVIVQKKGLGRKFKDIFIKADFRGAVEHVTMNVLIPAARDMVVDGATKGVERIFYGENAPRRPVHGPGPRFTYNTPVNRGHPGMRPASGQMNRQARQARQTMQDYILSDKTEAEAVLDQMIDIVSQYDVVSLADLNEMIGLPSSHVDNTWGWTDLRGARVQQVREGYLIDLPPAENI